MQDLLAVIKAVLNNENKKFNIKSVLRFYNQIKYWSTKRQISDTPTAKASWVLIYIHFQIYSKAYKTNKFL